MLTSLVWVWNVRKDLDALFPMEFAVLTSPIMTFLNCMQQTMPIL
jgi:hypothetical protein